MTKLTELEKEKAITCVYYVAKKFECDTYKLEIAYDKLGRYDEEYDKALAHATETQASYSNPAQKLKEAL